MGLGFNFFYLTWSPLTTLAIFQTTKNSLICQLNYFQVMLTSISDAYGQLNSHGRKLDQFQGYLSKDIHHIAKF